LKTECPKCGSESAWYSRTHTDLVLRCFCGLHKVVFTTLESSEIQTNDTEVKLPKLGSHLRKTLNVLSIFTTANSAEIAERLKDLGSPHSVSDVSTYLTILRSRGLVFQTEVKRGVPGGSYWSISSAASTLLGM
jgi:hypothetical protein